MKQRTHLFWRTGATSLLCLAATSPTQAQNVPVPDATLPVNSVVTSEDNTSTITGGTIAGENLFHSFDKFNIDEGQIADFVSPNAAIQNILARVTGSSTSKIMGTLSTSGLSNPNLFLINPNGIIFGRNARLEVGGSLVATTANAIEFGYQGFFSASTFNDPGLLTVNPSAFLFNQIAAQPINSIEIGNGAFISTGSLEKPGSLLLVGGNVSPSIAETGKILIDGGTLQAPGGRVELGGVAGSATVGLNVDSNNLRLSFPNGVGRADVSLTNAARVDVIGGGGGSITISAQNLDVLEGSELVAGIGSGLGSVGSQAGDITLNATGAMKIAKSSSITNDLVFRGNAGNILIKAGSLSLTDSATLATRTFGQGKAGDIFVQANNSVSIAANSSLITHLAEMGSGKGGDIKILARDLFLNAGSLLETSTSGEGRAGKVIIDAQDTVSVENSHISSETFGLWDGGNINIKVRALSLTEGAVLLSRTTGEGNAGKIQVNASDSVSISGVSLEKGFSSGLITETLQEDSGKGGDISVTSSVLRVSDGGVLSARTLSVSPGGNITVNVDTLEAINGGQLLTTAFSGGRAGDITVNDSDSVTISGSDPTYADRLDRFGRETVDPDSPASGLSAQAKGNGDAGGLTINTLAFTVADGAEATVSSQQGQAGNLRITANSIFLDRGRLSAVTAKSQSGTQGANITLQVQDLLLMSNESWISADALGQAFGGNINIDTNFLIALPPTGPSGSDIRANAFQGKGGRLDITASGIFGIEFRPSETVLNDITASSEFGVQGEVEINTPDVDPSRGLVTLPAEFVDASRLIAQGCPAGEGNVGRGSSEFIVTGRGGVPPQPGEALRTSAVVVNGGTLETKVENREPEVTSAPTPLVEAQGWIVNTQGQVVLTASAPTVTPNSSWSTPTTCHAS